MLRSTSAFRRPARDTDAGKPRGNRASLARMAAALAVAACLIAPSRADSALDWIVSAITGQGPNIEQVAATGSLSRGSVLQPNDQIATSNAERVVLTHGHDVLELEPHTTILIGDSGPDGMATIVKLIDGTVHVKVGKRAPGHTFAVETRYLVATVKGTEFDVTATDDAAAVAVTEGTVSVQAAGAKDGVDVTPGRTAVASALDGVEASVGPTPVGGAPAAAQAAGKSADAKGGSSAGGAAANGQAKGNGNANGSGSANGSGNSNGGSGNGGGSNGHGNGSGKNN